MAQDLATNIRGARLEILGPAGHLVTEECADRINETIIRFLATAPGTQKDGMEGDF
jgi:pimeloyl-ACP methyl ester carboxylesterase